MIRLVALCRRHPALLALPCALVIAVSVASVAGNAWYLTGDYAHTELLVRAIPSHPPLIGVAARVVENGSTPGPSMAYLLYPGYKLFGSDAHALVASMDLLHIAAIVGVVVVLRRWGGASLAAFVGLTLAVMTAGMAPQFFLEPWNVWVPVYAFALFVVLVWAISLDHIALMPLAVAAGSHCVQTHISYTLLVAGLLGGLVVWLAVLWWRTDRLAGRHPLRWLLVSSAVLLVAWLPPLIDQQRPGTGNLRKLYRQFTDPGEPFVGFGAAVKAMAGRFNLLGAWYIDPWQSPRARPNIVGLVGFVLLVGAASWAAWRRRQRAELALYAVLGGCTALGLLSTMRVFGVFFSYVIRWMSPLVALWVAAATWSLHQSLVAWWRSRPRRSPPGGAGRLALAIGAATMVTVSLVGVVRAAGGTIPSQRDSDTTGALADQLQRVLDPHVRYQVNENDVASLGSQSFGLVLELERRGLDVGIGPWGASGAMQFRVATDAESAAALWLVTSTPAIQAFATKPGVREIASYDPRTSAEARRSAALEVELIEQLCAFGGEEVASLLFEHWGQTALDFFYDLPPTSAKLLAEYNALRAPAAIFETPVGLNGYDTHPVLPEPCGAT